MDVRADKVKRQRQRHEGAALLAADRGGVVIAGGISGHESLNKK
jgi:hypothetical protein